MSQSFPRPGDKLELHRVWNLISEKLRAAYNDKSNEYQKLRDIFEAAYSYDLARSIEYIPSEDKFLIYDDNVV